MLIVSPSTATALAPHAAERSWVMFVQVNPPTGGLGPILIEGLKGAILGRRLNELSQNNAFEAMLIGLLETNAPEQHAHQIRAKYDDDRLHDYWFEPVTPLMSFIQQTSQGALQELLAVTHPGAISTTPVDIDEIARLLGVSVPTIRRMVQDKKIPCLRYGRILRFVPSEVIASLRYHQR